MPTNENSSSVGPVIIAQLEIYVENGNLTSYYETLEMLGSDYVGIAGNYSQGTGVAAFISNTYTSIATDGAWAFGSEGKTG